jgi:hypothetical protein
LLLPPAKLPVAVAGTTNKAVVIPVADIARWATIRPVDPGEAGKRPPGLIDAVLDTTPTIPGEKILPDLDFAHRLFCLLGFLLLSAPLFAVAGGATAAHEGAARVINVSFAIPAKHGVLLLVSPFPFDYKYNRDNQVCQHPKPKIFKFFVSERED